MLLDYLIDVRDTSGRAIIEANLNENFGFKASRKANGIGWFSLIVDQDRQRYLQPDYLVDVSLRFEDGTIKSFRSYFIRKLTFYRRGDNEERLIVEGPCPNYLLTSRIVAYAKGSAQADQTNQADDLIKEIVRDNLGTDAAAARNISTYLAVATDTAQHATITRGMSWEPVYDVIQGIIEDIASDSTRSKLYFDIEKTGPYAFQFKTYKDFIGVDRTSQGHTLQGQYFGVERGNLLDPELILDYSDEATYVYALPPGSGTDRTPTEVSDAKRLRRSAFARREAVVSVNSKTADALTSEANTALDAGRPRLKFKAGLVNTAGFRYGVHWNFGDKVQVRWGSVTGAGFGVYTGIVDYVEVGKLPAADGFREHFKASLEIEDVL